MVDFFVSLHVIVGFSSELLVLLNQYLNPVFIRHLFPTVLTQCRIQLFVGDISQSPLFSKNFELFITLLYERLKLGELLLNDWIVLLGRSFINFLLELVEFLIFCLEFVLSF